MNDSIQTQIDKLTARVALLETNDQATVRTLEGHQARIGSQEAITGDHQREIEALQQATFGPITAAPIVTDAMVEAGVRRWFDDREESISDGLRGVIEAALAVQRGGAG